MKSIHEWQVEKLFRELEQVAGQQQQAVQQQQQAQTPVQPGQAAIVGGNNQPPQTAEAEEADMEQFLKQVGPKYKALMQKIMRKLEQQPNFTNKKKAAVIAMMLDGMGISDASQLAPVFSLVKMYAAKGMLGQQAATPQQTAAPQQAAAAPHAE